jgi:hypothetical protein
MSVVSNMMLVERWQIGPEPETAQKRLGGQICLYLAGVALPGTAGQPPP